jgi:hypothetical protein
VKNLNPEKKLKFKLKPEHLLTAAALFIMFQGCVTGQISKRMLEFTITPETGIKAGTIVTVNVKTPDDVSEVYGSIDMMGSPNIPLKYDSKKRLWYLRQMVPLGIIIPPGNYLTKVEAITKAGNHYFAEKLITIQ